MLVLLFGLLLLQGVPAAKGTIVSGQVLLQDGSPAVAVRVAAITAPPPNIRPADGQNYYASQPPVSSALTDAKGQFRLANVPPGRFYIVAGIVGHGTFHPGTTDIDSATIVTTVADAPVNGVDFRMTTAPGSIVRGRVVPPPFADTQERAVLSGVTVGDLVDVPVNSDGTFEFGRIPGGEYFLSLIAQPPGLPAKPFQIANQDTVSIELPRPPTRPVPGRIVVQNGPLPRALLGFFTTQDYVAATINEDGTFTVRLHDARYRVDLGGMPIGYSVTSVRVGNEEVGSNGFDVPAAAKTGMVITVGTPRNLPRIAGRIAAGGSAPATARVVATGPIVGRVETPIRADGTFDFGPMPPGLYRLTVPQMPELATPDVVVEYPAGANVTLTKR
jgi:hypothetical protein